MNTIIIPQQPEAIDRQRICPTLLRTITYSPALLPAAIPTSASAAELMEAVVIKTPGP